MPSNCKYPKVARLAVIVRNSRKYGFSLAHFSRLHPFIPLFAILKMRDLSCCDPHYAVRNARAYKSMAVIPLANRRLLPCFLLANRSSRLKFLANNSSSPLARAANRKNSGQISAYFCFIFRSRFKFDSARRRPFAFLFLTKKRLNYCDSIRFRFTSYPNKTFIIGAPHSSKKFSAFLATKKSTKFL